MTAQLYSNCHLLWYHIVMNKSSIVGILSIFCALVALYTAFLQNIPYDNPISLVGIAAIVLGIIAVKMGSKILGVIGIVAGIPSTAMFVFLFLFFALGGSR